MNNTPWYSDDTHAQYITLLQLRRSFSHEAARVFDKLAARGDLPEEFHDALHMLSACLKQEQIVRRQIEAEL
jgi:hypothetical protein